MILIIDFGSQTTHLIGRRLKDIGITTLIIDPENAVKEITPLFLTAWNGQKYNDVYGKNIFEKLLHIKEPSDFYTGILMRNYYSLVDRFTTKKEEVYTKPMSFMQGKWYPVEFLDKNWQTGLPLFDIKETINAKQEVVSRTVVKRGKYPFILRKIRTEHEGVTKDIWTPVNEGKIVYRTPDFGKKKLKLKKKIKEVYKWTIRTKLLKR
jgi:hypothetical protein